MRSRISPMVLTMAVGTILIGFCMMAQALDDKDQARQHGYEHGYRDGYHHGREDEERHAPFNFKTKDFKDGDRGFDNYMGDHGKYKEGYRTGYQSGYDDAYNRREGRFAELYGHEDPRRDRDDYVFEGRPGYSPDMAYDIGQRDGFWAGKKYLRDHANFDPADQVLYRDGDHGYRNSYGNIELYRRDYREGFVQGYQDGYGRWR